MTEKQEPGENEDCSLPVQERRRAIAGYPGEG